MLKKLSDLDHRIPTSTLCHLSIHFCHKWERGSSSMYMAMEDVWYSGLSFCALYVMSQSTLTDDIPQR
jgi:hypothetical protein